MPNQHGDNSQFDTLSALTVSTTRSRLSSTRRLSVELVTTSSRHLTAWQCLVQVAGLTAGQKLLIHGGAGGVGHLAMQIGKAQGAHVTATASAG